MFLWHFRLLGIPSIQPSSQWTSNIAQQLRTYSDPQPTDPLILHFNQGKQGFSHGTGIKTGEIHTFNNHYTGNWREVYYSCVLRKSIKQMPFNAPIPPTPSPPQTHRLPNPKIQTHTHISLCGDFSVLSQTIAIMLNSQNKMYYCFIMSSQKSTYAQTRSDN